ncbi:hypothetical protein ABMA28_006955 [Loxostege sticticalis]|uniref:Uncharacterized protein n=1 Tax=Loxostege sticticalis TaxID=481309 RepID=A0ABD0TPG4_LOXSC
MDASLQESFERSCRLCAEEQEVTIMIFSEEAEAMLLRNKLNQYLLIEVDEDDKLPKNICIQCCSKLQTVCDFIDTARTSQDLLLKRSIMIDQYNAEKSFRLGNSRIKLEFEGSDDESKFTEMEVSVDPNVVLQNSEEPLSPSPSADENCTTFEDVTHLHDVDSENVTIKLIKKVDRAPEMDDIDEKKGDFNPKPFPCITCKRSFFTELALKNHSWIHINEEKSNSQFKCSTCNEGFDYKADLIQHLKVHRTNGVCQFCGRGFRTERNLAAHMAVHLTSSKSYTCKVCGRSYNTKSNLKTHSITHSNERPYHCHLCKKSFKRNQDLKFHINQHTGAKPYKCPFCEKSFASSGNCYSHRSRMHPGRRVEGKIRRRLPVTRENQPLTPRVVPYRPPMVAIKGVYKYQCTLCDHSFMKRDNFTYHMYQHTGEKPFQCSFCTEKFVTRRGLLIHHDKEHPSKDRPLALLSKNILLKRVAWSRLATYKARQAKEIGKLRGARGRGRWDRSAGRGRCAWAGGACVSSAVAHRALYQEYVGRRRASPSRASVVSLRWARSVSRFLRSDATMALNSDGEQKSNLVLRVDQDSDSVLQSLFDTVLKPDSKRPLQVPLRMRQLPKSFFNPPSTGSKSPSVSHSRENSADSAFGSSSATGAAPVSHSRAHSSPASLQQTYAAGQQTQPQPLLHQHAKHRSYDVGSHLQDDLGPLPAGWEQARTPEGQIYYLNHITKTTTWDDPRKTLAAQAAAAVAHQSAETLLPQPASAPAITPAATPAKSTSSNTTTDPLGPLPEGWEQATTPEAQHLQRTPAANAGAAGGGWANASLQACQQKIRLQSLQLERDRLKQRQQEIRLQQELMARSSSIMTSLASSTGAVASTELSLDPFLSGLTDHQRQESADSGLGMAVPRVGDGDGLFSIPHTPEDFLAGMDDRMDCSSEAGANMDSTDMAIGDNLDSTDDLVPSLQLNEFTNDILLDDVQSLINSTPSKPDNVLTWL